MSYKKALPTLLKPLMKKEMLIIPLMKTKFGKSLLHAKFPPSKDVHAMNSYMEWNY